MDVEEVTEGIIGNIKGIERLDLIIGLAVKQIIELHQVLNKNGKLL